MKRGARPEGARGALLRGLNECEEFCIVFDRGNNGRYTRPLRPRGELAGGPGTLAIYRNAPSGPASGKHTNSSDGLSLNRTRLALTSNRESLARSRKPHSNFNGGRTVR